MITLKVALGSGKAGEALPADTNLQNAAVTLYALKGQSPVYRREGVTDAAGTATFTAVPYEDGYGFGVVAKMGLTPYISDVVAPTAGASEVLVPVKVYGTTTDASKLRVSQAFVLAEAQGDGKLGITNLYILSNAGDKTVEGGLKDAEGKAATVQFPLPSGAQDVKFGEDDGNRNATAARSRSSLRVSAGAASTDRTSSSVKTSRSLGGSTCFTGCSVSIHPSESWRLSPCAEVRYQRRKSRISDRICDFWRLHRRSPRPSSRAVMRQRGNVGVIPGAWTKGFSSAHSRRWRRCCRRLATVFGLFCRTSAQKSM